MGGRSGPSAHQILGSGRRGDRRKSKLESKLISGGSGIVAKAAFQTAAMSVPVIGAAYVAYEAAKFTYPIFKEGMKESRKTDDSNRILEKMSEETFRQTG